MTGIRGNKCACLAVVACLALATAGCAGNAPSGDTPNAASPSSATSASTSTSTSGTASTNSPWGYPLDALDRSVRPGDDFFRYANGGWLDRTSIPSDRPGVGFSTEMSERNEARVAAIVAELANADVAPGSIEQKIRDLYRSYMDTALIEKRGLEPLANDLARISALKSHEDVAAIMADGSLRLASPFAAAVEIDSREPTRYAVYLSHAGLHLPNKVYYESDDQRMKDIRAAYEKHIETMFGLGGIEGGAQKARSIVELETRIAALHWDIAERRKADRTFNYMTLAELEAFAPAFPWKAYLAARGLGAANSVIVREKDAFPAIASLFKETPVAVWRDYLTFSLLDSHARYLPQAFAQESFEFFGKRLGGQIEERARDKLGIALVSGALNQAVGKIYVERHFPPEWKAQVTEMVENLRRALRTRIERLTWMSPATKQAALEKLARMTAKVGYPEKWRDYSALHIDPTDLLGNVKRARASETAHDAAHLSAPVDKREWITGPQLVNAFYDPQANEVVVPAGYIQPPLFDAAADAAINYGALGSIIGHEIAHGFDDQGSRSDGEGRLRDWWTPEDRAAFDALGTRLAAQFDRYEVFPGLFVNGRATLGENLADLGGLILACDAYKLSLGGREPPVLDGFTGLQRVFLGRAQARRFKATEEFERRRLLSGVHTPMSLRVNGSVRNIDEWYEAFDVQPGDALYLPPEERVRIW